jgi:hypothetical protein
VIGMPRAISLATPTSPLFENIRGRAGPGSDSRRREFQQKYRGSIIMTGLKALAAAALLSTISATAALADDPDAFQAQYPDRDILNGGALTPAARQGLVAPFGAAGARPANGPYAGPTSAGPALPVRHHGHRHMSR